MATTGGQAGTAQSVNWLRTQCEKKESTAHICER